MKSNYYNQSEENINIITHALGLIASVVALFLLVNRSINNGNFWHIISALVFGVSLITLYAASTFYHASKSKKLRKRLNIFDHASIYLLIAGTYTPYALITLHGTLGWWIFGINWSLALIGIILKFFYTGQYDKLSTIMYVLMGWVAVFIFKSLSQNLGNEGVFWLLFGGIMYTIGAVFYSLSKVKYNHAIFHVFVLLGSISHFISIYFYVM